MSIFCLFYFILDRIKDTSVFELGHQECFTHHQYVRDCFKELHEFGETIVAELALTTKVVVVGGDKLTKGHSAVRLVTKEVHHLLPKLLGTLHFIHCPFCGKLRKLLRSHS